MGYKIKGELVSTCACQLICPCAVDGPPTTKDGKCRGGGVFHITEGSMDGTDLSGVNVGMMYTIPGNVTGGNWTVGFVVDPSISDDQAKAVEMIFRGEAGGSFGEFAPLMGKVLPTERAPITFTPGKNPSATIGKSKFDFSALADGEGNPTTVHNAMFGWAPEFVIGKGSGKVDVQGVKYDAIYGDFARFEYAG
jgi:hypothetical protein